MKPTQNGIAFGAALAVLAVFLIYFYSWRQDKKAVDAGQALTQAVMTPDSGQLADACLKIAADYPGTPAGQRALLQGAAALFAAGRYADAQTQFQKFLDVYPDNQFSHRRPSLGVAASLDAQGKTDLATGAYQRTINSTADPWHRLSPRNSPWPKLTSGRAKSPTRLNLYEEVAHA